MKSQEKSIYERVRGLSNRNKFLWLVIIGLVLLIILLFTQLPGMSPQEKIGELLFSIFSAIITICLFEFMKNKIDEEEHDNHIQSILWKMMRAKKDNMINQLYKEEAVDDVVHNCLENYCEKLADSYFKYIKDNVNIYRSEMIYEVIIGKTIGSSFPIKQVITYRKNFKVHELKKQYVFKCFFATKPGALEKRLCESDWFFREEITDNETIARINNNRDDKIYICNLLKLKLGLYQNNRNEIDEIHNDDIEMCVYEDGVSFSVNITDEYFTSENYGDTTDKEDFKPNYISYKARVTCEINNKDKQFYCVFTDPTISPEFKITFRDDETIKVGKDGNVNRVSCLTLPNSLQQAANKSTSIIDDTDLNRILFKSNNNVIFPRSGIYFNW